METITEKHFEKPVQQTAGPKVVKFTNFSNEDFTWSWNKIPYTFPAGSIKFMESGIAVHFAKHLINRELLKRGRENDTSPKEPSENPYFMELFNKCIQVMDTGNGVTDQTKLEQDAIDANMKASMDISSDMTPSVKVAPDPLLPMTPRAEVAKVEEEKEFELLEGPDDEETAPQV